MESAIVMRGQVSNVPASPVLSFPEEGTCYSAAAMNRFLSALVMAVSALVIHSQAATNVVYVPQELENAHGNTWTYGFAYHEFIYDPSFFGGLASRKILLTSAAFRLEEEDSAFQAIWPQMKISANVFPGSMEDVIRRRTAVTNPVVVFSASDLPLGAGQPNSYQFSFEFPFQTPFVYDPRLGKLVLRVIGPSPVLFDLDAQSVPLVSEEIDGKFVVVPQGAAVVIYGSSDVRGVVVATKFSYVASEASFEEALLEPASVRMRFRVSGPVERVTLESTLAIGSPFVEETAQPMNVSGDLFEVSVPRSILNRFFRVRLD